MCIGNGVSVQLKSPRVGAVGQSVINVGGKTNVNYLLESITNSHLIILKGGNHHDHPRTYI